MSCSAGLLVTVLTCAVFACAVFACAGPAKAPEPAPANPAPAVVAPAGAAVADLPRLVFLGDSLTAGYTLAEAEAFPARLGKLLAAKGLPVEVVNAGVSGDTSAGGLRRLSWLLRQEPDLLIVELGGNDGLRGLPIAETRENLRRIVEGARAGGSRVLLVGMRIPTNYGPDYAGAFAALYPQLANELDVPLVPFLLEGIADRLDLFLPDGIHPTAAGHELVAAALLPHLEPLVRELTAADSR